MNRGAQIQMAMPFTPMVKKLMIITVSVWIVLQVIVENLLHWPITPLFGMIPGRVIYDFFIWQPFTYIFLHSTNVTHILFNMLLLWWLGADLEMRWGAKLFLTYYLVSGVGAGLIYTIVIWTYSLFSGQSVALSIPVIGASGSIFGLMVAFGILFGDRIIYAFLIFPMKAKYFVMILGAVELLTLINNGVAGGEVANLAHLGGLVSGFLFLYGWTRFSQKKWKKGASKRGRNLRLVVDNERDQKDKKGDPKYWN